MFGSFCYDKEEAVAGGSGQIWPPLFWGRVAVKLGCNRGEACGALLFPLVVPHRLFELCALWYVALHRLRGSQHPRIFYYVFYELKRGHANPQPLSNLNKDHWSSQNIHIHAEPSVKLRTFLRLKTSRHTEQ